MNADRAGSPVANYSKKQIVKAVNKARPAAPPILAMSSASLFNFSCNGARSGSPRRAVKQRLDYSPKLGNGQEAHPS